MHLQFTKILLWPALQRNDF